MAQLSIKHRHNSTSRSYYCTIWFDNNNIGWRQYVVNIVADKIILIPHSDKWVCNSSVPARHIYEGAAPCPYWLAPCPIYKRPARIMKKNLTQQNYSFFFLHLQNVIAVVFSDSWCKNTCACRFVPMFSSITLLNCARFCVVCALNCARTLVVRALDCAQFLSHPSLFPNLAGTLNTPIENVYWAAHCLVGSPSGQLLPTVLLWAA